MSHAFFRKYLAVLRTPVVFGKVSSQAAKAVWGGPSNPSNGLIGPIAPVGSGSSIPPVVSGPVDPNHPGAPAPDPDNQTPVQTTVPEDNPQTSTTIVRSTVLTFETPDGDYPPGTTVGVTIPTWSTGDASQGTRSICTTCTANGQPAGIIFDETIGVTGWHITGLEGIPDGTPLDIQLKGTSQLLSPPDAFGNRTSGPASDFTLSLTGEASGDGASGDMSGAINSRWDVHENANGASGNGVQTTDGGETGGVAPGAAPIYAPEARQIAVPGADWVFLRMGYPRLGTRVEYHGAGGFIIEEDYVFPYFAPPGLFTWTWSDGVAIPEYHFSVGVRVVQFYLEGGINDPNSTDYVPPDYGEIDLGGPVYDDPDPHYDDMPADPKDGYYEPPPAPTVQPPDPPSNTPEVPDVLEPKTVNPPYVAPDDSPEGDGLPMLEYPLTKDIVIRTTMTSSPPTETSMVPDGKDVLLDYTGFNFVSGTGFSIDETVMFKHLPLNARVEDQPATEHGFYTAVVGPFTGARFREMVDDTSARVELFWDGPGQPFILFRKMPTRAASLATSTTVFKEISTLELSRNVTINWTVDLPVPFGLGYEYSAESSPGRILLRRMQSPSEPHMETEIALQRYDFGETPQMSWQYLLPYRSALSNGGNVLVWEATVTHTITFATP